MKRRQPITNALVEEHEIMLKAYARAEVVAARQARTDNFWGRTGMLKNYISGALQYTEEMVANWRSLFQAHLKGQGQSSEAFTLGLSSNLEICD